MSIAVVIPCYRVRDKVEAVIDAVSSEFQIVCVDDGCPEKTGDFVASLKRPNVTVIRNEENRGVGGAVKAGFEHLLEHTTAEVLVKLDGDGQMPGERIIELSQPILIGRADYVKGNRFYRLRNLRGMPFVRLIGNSFLSFLTKLSSGYWDLMDPTNGFIAIRRELLADLELETVDDRYFFESDMLHALYMVNAVVFEFPMVAKYDSENSSLKPLGVLLPFLGKHLRNTLRRIFYSYYMRDFNAGSLALLLGTGLATFGSIYSLGYWSESLRTGVANPPGVVMLAALSLIFALQFFIFFLTVDMQNSPNMRRNLWHG